MGENTVYIEYAIAGNFFLDGILLVLAVVAARGRLRAAAFLIAAAVGAAFAVLFPLCCAYIETVLLGGRSENFIKAANFIKTAAKILFGFILGSVAYVPRADETRRKDRLISRAKCGLWLIFFTFSLGGGLTAAFSYAPVPFVCVSAAACLFFLAALYAICKLRKKRAVRALVRDCVFERKGKTVCAPAFLDSGNRATADGLPLCFLAADLALGLLDEREWTGGSGDGSGDGSGGEVFKELTITTMGGKKRIKYFSATVKIYCADGGNIIKQVCLSPTAHIHTREYRAILSGIFLEGGTPI